ncbi:MAG: hypothetical protein V7K62_24930 [Nostoc sp.]
MPLWKRCFQRATPTHLSGSRKHSSATVDSAIALSPRFPLEKVF